MDNCSKIMSNFGNNFVASRTPVCYILHGVTAQRQGSAAPESHRAQHGSEHPGYQARLGAGHRQNLPQYDHGRDGDDDDELLTLLPQWLHIVWTGSSPNMTGWTTWTMLTPGAGGPPADR